MSDILIKKRVDSWTFGAGCETPQELQENKETALVMMQRIFEDPDYVKDPVQYVRNMLRKGDDEDDYRIPDDDLVSIFCEVYNVAKHG